MSNVKEIVIRPRRNRCGVGVRRLVAETRVTVEDLVMPIFVVEGDNKCVPIAAMPGICRLGINCLLKEIEELYRIGIKAVALFPCVEDLLKDSYATESKNPRGLYQRAISSVKKEFPDVCVISDVAMDPYSSDGHDGLVVDGEVMNDETLPILADMAVLQARAGSDIIAPSDMMDGRVGFIRSVLDAEGFTKVGILAYSAKYCSSFYGPFREALNSLPNEGGKESYQMDPANGREALREVLLDIEEGADMVMVKPALAYLDVIYNVKKIVEVPVVAYNVSGEYAMIYSAFEKGWLEKDKCIVESLTSIKRAGADIIFTYFAKEFAQLLTL